MSIQADGTATTSKSTFRLEVAVGITVRAPAAPIWTLLTKASDYPRWNSTVLSILGTIALGETIQLRSSNAPGRTFKLRVTTFTPPDRMVWEDGTPLFKGVRHYTLTPRSSGVTVVTMAETFSGLMLPLIARSLPDQAPAFERFLADLKAEAERGI